jgi:hypothetical protein
MPYNGKQQKYGISAGFLETRGMREKEKKTSHADSVCTNEKIEATYYYVAQ